MNTTTTTYGVTQEQIDKCDRYTHENTNEVFYLVESQTTADTYYKVTWNTQFHRLQCTCKAGQSGNGCWHKRAVLAAAKEYRELKKAQKLAQERQELMARIQHANEHPYQWTEEEIKRDQQRFAPRPFRLMH